MTKTRLLFFIILVEGYVVLAIELLAIRQLLPFAGSGVEVIAIIVGGVLMPLAVGYHYGGTAWRRAFARAKKLGRPAPPVRAILRRNLLIALFILAAGLSYPVLEGFFAALSAIGLRNLLLQTAVYTLLFLMPPVFLLGQTVPLVSHSFPRRRLSEITGRMLFFSTAGAFFGSIFSTLVLMSTIGVHNTVIVTMGLLALPCILLSRKKGHAGAAAAIAVFLLAASLNSNYSMRRLGIVSDNAYNLARVIPLPREDAALLILNRSISSKIARDPENLAPYLKYIEKNFINTLPKTGASAAILVLGAGGFTVGAFDTFDDFTFVDIDPDLKDVAEKYFLGRRLPLNQHFVASSARAFLERDRNKYDLVFIDLFQNSYAVPPEATTREFLQSARARLKENGVLIVNIAASPDFRDKLAVRYDRTFSSVFPAHNRAVIGDFDPWRVADGSEPSQYFKNIIYSAFNRAAVRDDTIYTDDKNTYSLDRP